MLKMLDKGAIEGGELGGPISKCVILYSVGMPEEGVKKQLLDSREKPSPEGKVLSEKLSKKGFKEEKQRLPRNMNSRNVGCFKFYA